MNQYFTPQEAEALVGDAVTAERAHGSILDGMSGRVTAAETLEGDDASACVVVEWRTDRGAERYRYSRWEWHGLLRRAGDSTRIRHLPG